MKPGDKARLVSAAGGLTPLGNRKPRIKNFLVLGLFECGMHEYDSMLAYISLGEAQKLLGLGDNITGLEVRSGTSIGRM